MSTQTQNKPVVRTGKKELREWLQGEEFKRELSATLPRTMSPERFVRIAFQATYRVPDLLKCSQESFFNCLLQLSALGLEPDGRRAHLIPFGDVCTLVIDYKGIKEVVRRNKDVTSMHGDVVGDNDEFELRYGTRGILDHKPNLRDRGKIYCAYSWVKLPNGDEEYDVMSIDEIEVIRKRSRSPNKGPWVTDWNEMAKKTVFRRHAKGLPLSPETREALDRDDDADSLTDQERFNSAAPARASVMGRPQRRIPLAPENEADNDESISKGSATSEESPKAPAGDDKPAGAAAPLPEEYPTGVIDLPLSQPPPSLQSQVAKKLTEAGFSVVDLLRLMKPLRLAPKDAQSLDDIADNHLIRVLQDWQNCLARLTQEREAAQGAP